MQTCLTLPPMHAYMLVVSPNLCILCYIHISFHALTVSVMIIIKEFYNNRDMKGAFINEAYVKLLFGYGCLSYLT